MLGENCIVGRGAYVGTGVRIGDNCKIQNYALVYEPAVLEDGVFVGPAVVFTNDHYPRAVNPDGTLKSGDDWEAVGVTVPRGRLDRRPGRLRRAGDHRALGARRRRLGGHPATSPTSPWSPGCPRAAPLGRPGGRSAGGRARRPRALGLPADRREVHRDRTTPSRRLDSHDRLHPAGQADHRRGGARGGRPRAAQRACSRRARRSRRSSRSSPSTSAWAGRASRSTRAPRACTWACSPRASAPATR